jgi:hypothetical protein
VPETRGAQREYLYVQRHLSKLKTKLARDNLAQDRITSFRVRIDADWERTCWVENQTRSSLSHDRKKLLECHLGHLLEFADGADCRPPTLRPSLFIFAKRERTRHRRV